MTDGHGVPMWPSGVPMWPSVEDRHFREIVKHWHDDARAYRERLLDLPTPTAQHIRAKRDYAQGIKRAAIAEYEGGSDG